MHVIPDLKKLEEKFGDRLAVIGVHSAKFENERDDETIRQAILKNEIRHPVINDANFAVWKAFGARGWPTFVVIDPNGGIAFRSSGEGQYQLLEDTISGLIKEAGDKINTAKLPLALEKDRAPASPLSFPGKVLVDGASNTLYISDTNHNRILIGDLDGKIREVVGSGVAGAKDGDFVHATFDHPQGLTLDEGHLFVADTGNHLIRKISLRQKKVTTVLGTGKQENEPVGGKSGTSQGVNSPWDLALDRGKIYIAMAGRHQIWEYDPKSGVGRAAFGTGHENIVDGPAASAALAQPSGVSVLNGKLYFADSEVSAIRSADLAAGTVSTLFGKGLFDFGDIDGGRESARLQHPLGVATGDGKLYVADSYNHRIKIVDLESGTIRSLAGDGGVGNADGTLAQSRFSEPGGLAYAGGKLYVADTNNHAIRRIDLASDSVSTLKVVLPEAAQSAGSSALHAGVSGFLPNLSVVTLEPRTVDRDKPLNVELKLALEKGYHLNAEAPSTATISFNGTVLHRIPVKEELLTMTAHLPPGAAGTLRLDSTLYYCNSETKGACLIKSFSFLQPLEFTLTDLHGEATVRFEAQLEPQF
jgi:DNA-binding beta-propeller fold protein YncE